MPGTQLVRPAQENEDTLMLNCQETSRLLSESHDRPLTLRERLSLRLHLLMCDACSHFARQLRFLHKAVTALEIWTLADDRLKLGERARERIKRALHDGGDRGPVS